VDDLKGNERILEIEMGSTRSHPVENSPWKRLWTSRKTDCAMNKYFALGERQTIRRCLSKLEVAEVACSQEPAAVNTCLLT
jgi:hypothetical protein